MAGIPNPKRGLIKFFESPYAYDPLIAVSALCGGYASYQNAYRAGHKDIAVVVLLAALAIFIFSSVKAVIQLKNNNEAESTEPLYGALHVLHHLLLDRADDDSVRVRVALYRPHDKDRLQQATNYVGETTKRTTRGRLFSNRCGIIGSAYRKKSTVAASLKESDRESFVSTMKTDWFFNDKDARALTPDVRSWMAIPIMDPDGGESVIGLVYCDATAPEFFQSNELQQLAINCSLGIARFVGSRYKDLKPLPTP
jgi:hypothetical protein